MEHHDWEWSDNDGGHGDAETADLSGGDDLGHSEGYADFGDHDLGGQELGGHDFGAGPDDLGGAHLSHDNLDEPLGTENAVGAYDADIADHGGADTHDDPGHTDPGHTDPGHADPGHTDDPGHTGDPDPAGHGTDPHAADPDPHDGHADHSFDVGHGDATGDHLVGVDPDLDHRADDPGWHDDPFPPELHLDATPEPVDGFPWVDPATLGGHDVDDYSHTVTGADAHDLAQYGGVDLPDGSDPWTALFGAEDPATSSLAQWWAPNG